LHARISRQRLFNTLTAKELRELRDLAEEKRKEHEEEAKELLRAKFREQAEEMGMSLDAIFPPPRRSRRDAGKPLPVKYRSPDGETWSGRGFPPQWLTKLESEGHNREEYKVEE
jgi:DNA-binding protein H-NS